MERRIQYEVLENEDDTPAVPAASATVVQETNLTPATVDVTEDHLGVSPEAGDMLKIPEPPSYNVATTLPSYEEAERSKQEQEEERAQEEDVEDQQVVQECERQSDLRMGTDAMFACTFIIAFLFNWIGLMASLCISHTIAGRLGALAGFGLSLVKWVAIIKHNNLATGVAENDSWLWWMLIILGFVIFFRGCIQYIRIKAQYSRFGQLQGRMYLYF